MSGFLYFLYSPFTCFGLGVSFLSPRNELIGINWIFWDLFQWILRVHPEELHPLRLLDDTAQGLLSIPSPLRGHPALLLGTQALSGPGWIPGTCPVSGSCRQDPVEGSKADRTLWGAQEKPWCLLLPLGTSPLLCQWLTALSVPRRQPNPLCYSMLQSLLQENANDVSPDNLLAPQWAFHNGHLFQLN